MDRAERDEFIGKLKRWKHEGCSVLVVGEALDLLRGTSDCLLGEGNRYRAFVLTDGSVRRVYDRLPDVRSPGVRARTKILDYESIPRSAADAASARNETIPEVPVYGGLDRLYDEVAATLTEFESRSGGLTPGGVRLSVDTLRPLLEAYDRDSVCHWLTHVGSATKRHHGIGHYLLPKPYESEVVQDLQGQFEAVIEVRSWDEQDGDRKERWHVPGSDLTTPWRAVDDEARGMM